MFKERLKGFLAGVCVTALVAGTVTVFAQTIDVAMGGIKVYWDGVEKTLYDANGSKVEPMIYKGTTYVPLRAMSNLMGKEVDWDQQTLSVYVGEKPVSETTPLEQFPSDKIDYANVSVLTGQDATFKLKDETVQCSNLLLAYGSSKHYSANMYILNGQYSRFVGKAVMPYENVGASQEGHIIFSSVGNDGSRNEIAKYDFRQTQDPIDIDVNLTGVVNLQILWEGSTVALYDTSILGN